MSERLTYFINKPYAVDSNACLRYGEGYQKILKPCEPIEDMSLCIGRLDNPVLKTHRLMIADYDRDPIKVTLRPGEETEEIIELKHPGKSTFILFEPNACDKMFIQDTVRQFFRREPSRRHHVHVALGEKIVEAGWLLIYAPLQMNRLFDHVRLVAKRTVEMGQDPTEDDVERLKSVFTLIPNLHG